MLTKTTWMMIILMLGLTSMGQPPGIQMNMLLHTQTEAKKVIDSQDRQLKMRAIAYLLTKKGDHAVNRAWVHYTDPMEQLYHGAMISTSYDAIPYASNQLVALYLISAIHHSDLRFCSEIMVEQLVDGMPVLETCNLIPTLRPAKNPRTVVYKVAHRAVLLQLYEIYETWYAQMSQRASDVVPDPLSGTPFRWKGAKE